MKYITNPKDVPKGAHLAVLQGDSVHIPGDERSRTNPGHGYPASTHSYLNYIVMDSEQELEKWIGRERHSCNTFAVIRAQGLTVETEVKVKLS